MPEWAERFLVRQYEEAHSGIPPVKQKLMLI